MLGPYTGPDVVDHSGWFSRRNKKKATQTMRMPFVDPPKEDETPPPSLPPTPPSPDPIPDQQADQQPLQLPDCVSPLIDGFFAPINFGLGFFNSDQPNTPPDSNHNSPPI